VAVECSSQLESTLRVLLTAEREAFADSGADGVPFAGGEENVCHRNPASRPTHQAEGDEVLIVDISAESVH
jgi:hypothetical protein